MNYSILEVKERVTADNDLAAEENRALLRGKKILFINLMGSPGAGKTSVLLSLIRILGAEYRIGVMEADADSDVDAETVERAGVRVIQLHTAGLCHMDADMTARGLRAMDLEGLDFLFLENVGNLVCPAEFEVGADLRIVVLSVPEGDDKPLKYPLMFQVSDIMLINKTDALPVFDFDLKKAEERAKELNPDIRVFPVSAKEETGFQSFSELLREEIRKRREEG